MTRNWKVALAVVTLLGAVGSASALEMQVRETGENFDVDWRGERDNIVGGGAAILSGGGDNATTDYAGSTQSGPRMVARLSGGGEDTTVTYAPPAQPPTMLAQRRSSQQ